MQQLLNNAITANQIEGSVSASSSVVNQGELKLIVQSWISKQGKHWPTELNADALTDNLKLFHLPYWVVSGKGSAQWSASIGVDRQVPKRCGTCDGRGRYTPIWSTDERRCDNCAGTGQALGTETFWSSQSGFVEAEASNQVRENFDSTTLNLKCGDRQFKVDSFGIENTEISTYNVIAPTSTNGNAGKHAAQLAVEDALRNTARSIASGMGSVRDLQVGYVQTSNAQFETWLYPMYFGYYTAGNEQLPIQVDGITKKIWAEVPSDVKSLRRKDRNRKIGYGVASLLAFVIFVLIADFFVMVLHPCGDFDNMMGNPSGCVIGINPSFPWSWDQASISPEGELVAIRNSWGFDTGSYVELRQIQDGKLLYTLPIGDASQPEELTFSPDGNFLAIGDDNTVTLWQVSGGKLIHTFNSVKTSSSDHPNYAWGIDFSPDGKMLAVGYHDGTAKIWRLSDYQLLHTLKGHNDSVRAIAFSPDGKLIATGDSDGSLRLWQISSGELLEAFDGHTRGISGVAFSPDNKLIITASGNGLIELWDVSSGELIKTIQVDLNNDEWIRNLQASPDDGTTVAISIYNQSNNSRVQLWDIEKERRLQTTSLGLPAIFPSLRGMRNDIIGFNYASDGKLFMIQSQDTNSLGIISLDRVFSPGDLFPVIAVREIEP